MSPKKHCSFCGHLHDGDFVRCVECSNVICGWCNTRRYGQYEIPYCADCLAVKLQ